MTARLAWCALAILAGHAASAEETCRYSGTTSYSGRVAVETRASAANGDTTVDVTARVNARSLGLIGWQYLYQEIGSWRDGELRSVGVNHRYSVLGTIRRQQWDLFDRTPNGLAGWRAEANSPADFKANHAGFMRHWDPATFGEPWLVDFPAAAPDRRADLDLPLAAMPKDLGTPLPLAFYWVRWAGVRDRTIPVFLPGFKHNARVDIQVVSRGVEAGGLLHLHSSVRHPQLGATKVSTGDAWISADHQLMRVTFEANADYGSASGALHLDGCQGEPPAP